MSFEKIKKAIKHPDKIYRFVNRKFKKAWNYLFWDFYYAALREPKIKSAPFNPQKLAIPNGPEIHKEIVKELRENNFNVIEFEINIADYRTYIHDAEYQKFPNYKPTNFIKKSLEHYLAAKILNLSYEDVYIDIASAASPAPEIYRKLYGCKVYKQDLTFPEGLHGNVIGGDAGNMPVDNGFATKMALHCSFEHFEQDADIRFIKEAGRVLSKGGELCIVPLYLFNQYVIQTDPAVLPKGGIPFESDAVLYCVKGWGNRHGRFYSIPKLVERIKNNLNSLALSVYVIQNEKEVDPSCYTKYIALFKKE
jgi:hypothetical protein